MHSNVLGRLCTITNGFVHNELALLSQRLPVLHVQVRGHLLPKPKWRYPKWYLKRERAGHVESLTKDNENFVKEVVEDKYGPIVVTGGVATSWRSPLKIEPMSQGEWTEKTKRTGVIARKIGVYPLWFKNGKKILTTLLQVADNHVVRYYPPGEFKQARQLTRAIQYPDRCGCLLVGADSADPRTFTKEYCGLFANSGVMPKKFLGRFFVSPEAALAPGTPLLATHFRVGDYVDVRGNTIDRGFQGVMVRWGFKGQPASHGQTKTHRRPGNIGAGGEKGRVWPGTKMPGHMGNRWRILRGLRIWRINTQYNVMWVSGPGVAGETGSYVYVYDTILPNKKPTEAPPFPTASLSFAEQLSGPDVFQEDLHQFAAPSITFSESK